MSKSELVQEVQTLCTEGKSIIVVNENNLCETEKCTEESLDPLPLLAKQFKYSIYITPPCKKPIPIYSAWLLNEYDSTKLLSDGKDTLEKLLDVLPQFSDSFKNFSGQTSIQDMLKYYQLAPSNSNGMLHCTAKYLANGTTPGSFQYWNKPEIQANLGRRFPLDVIGMVWTPRTFGARVKLSKEQLELWGNDVDNTFYTKKTVDTVKSVKKPDFAPVKGRGSRAHITVGVADGVKAVVTGHDLLEIVRLEDLQKDWPTYDCNHGWWLRDYGEGRWVLYSETDTKVLSLFDGVYG